jgi:hypothetical protein
MGNIYVTFNELYMNGDLLPALKGNNSCKTDNSRIKVGNVQMVYSFSFKVILQ